MEVEAYHLAGLQEIAILKAQLRELWGTETTRTEYHPQEEGGRHLGFCESCGAYEVIKARGLCQRCYMRFYRARRQIIPGFASFSSMILSSLHHCEARVIVKYLMDEVFY